MYFYQARGKGIIVSKEDVERTVGILKNIGMKIEFIQSVSIDDCGMWLETDEEKDLLEGDIIKENKVNYMKLDNKLMRFYSINEICKMKEVDVKKAEKNIIIFAKNGTIKYVNYN